VRHITGFLILLLSAWLLLAIPASLALSGPTAVAGLGDSITQANSACCERRDHPGLSWSTGDQPDDAVRSHFERLRELHPAITRNNYNNAVSGAKAADLPGQVAKTVAQKPDYITLLIGANDLCAPSASSMTSPRDFADDISASIGTLSRELPHAQLLVSSIPDLYQMWAALHSNPEAARAWSASGICQSMFSAENTEEQRQLVVSRQQDFNRILAEACAQHRNCRWDGGAVYNYRFSGTHISTLDYFHPGIEGQAVLAELTWEARGKG
jgi:lysophospholipase L1-like esterase